MKKILHTEASTGWGGQEIRILEESLGMRERGHLVVFAIQKGGRLAKQARHHGFLVYELNFKKTHFFSTFFKLRSIVKRHHIDLINTHSSSDAWIGGIVGRILRKSIIRTRHLSTSIKKGLNSYLLYGCLADAVMTTCEEVAGHLKSHARFSISIPTGIRPEKISVSASEKDEWRHKWNASSNDCVVGTLCVLRSWKGIEDFLGAAKELIHEKQIRWVIVGGGPGEKYFRQRAEELGLRGYVFFTGHLDNPFKALAAFDIFLLLSTKHEGVSQASLQAAYLQKPLITTSIGGLKEVCLPQKTGILVEPHSPKKVAQAVLTLVQNEALREEFGKNGQKKVLENFTFNRMIDQVEMIYQFLEKGKIL